MGIWTYSYSVRSLHKYKSFNSNVIKWTLGLLTTLLSRHLDV